jgi:hypothetical protein
MSQPKEGSKIPTRVCAVLPLPDEGAGSTEEVITGLGAVKGFFLSVTDCELKIFNNSATSRHALSADHLETISYGSKGCVPFSTRGFSRDSAGRSVTLSYTTKGASLHVYNQIPPVSKSKGMLGAITSLATSGVSSHHHSENLLSHVLVSYNAFKTSSKVELNPFVFVSKVAQKKSIVHKEGSFDHGVLILYTSNLKYVRPTSPLTEFMGSGRMYFIIAIAIVIVFWKRIFGRSSKGSTTGRSLGNNNNNKFRNNKMGVGRSSSFNDDDDYDM